MANLYIISPTNQRKIKEKGMETKDYKEFLIDGILEFQSESKFTKEALQNKSIRALEIIFDNVK